MASQLPSASVTTPSASIMGSSGVNAKRPTPMATASASMPAKAMARGCAVQAGSACISILF
jgi:hypothetical protein